MYFKIIRHSFCFQLYTVLEDSPLNMSGAFYLYAGVITLAMPIVYVVLPETKNVSLELIPKYFEPKKTVFYVDLEKQEDLS